jgi:ATP synthase protein I
MLPATLKRQSATNWPGMEVAVAASRGPGKTGSTGPGDQASQAGRDEDLERRRKQLEASLSSRRPAERDGAGGAGAANNSGFAQALKLSSEFVAAIAVGAGIGWLIDRVAGISPWGLIVFLLLGFCAGVLNVLRSAGMMAEAGGKGSQDGPPGPPGK